MTVWAQDQGLFGTCLNRGQGLDQNDSIPHFICNRYKPVSSMPNMTITGKIMLNGATMQTQFDLKSRQFHPIQSALWCDGYTQYIQ